MPLMANPFEFAASDAAAEQAAVSSSQPPAQDAAADLSHSGATDCSLDEAAAAPRQSDLAAADICDIGEIFVGARKLIDPDEHRFVLDVERFMNDIDESPLFLRRAV